MNETTTTASSLLHATGLKPIVAICFIMVVCFFFKNFAYYGLVSKKQNTINQHLILAHILYHLYSEP
jgi:hypothetical protein